MPKVSVIIPVFNTEKYLQRCLDSVCNQTLSDIEIICINDASTDNSLEILKEYQKEDERIKIIDLNKNQGAGYSRNRGIEIAKGEYIGFVDSDDFIDLDFYEKLYKKAIETGADVVKSNLNYTECGITTEEYYNVKNVRENKLLLNHLPTTIIRKVFLIDNKIFYPEDLKCAEDSVIETKIALKANKIEIESTVCYYYARRNESLNRTQLLSIDKVKEVEKSVKEVIGLFNNAIIDEKDYIKGLESRYKYLSFFIQDKKPSDEIIKYTNNAEKEIFSLLKYKPVFKQLEIQKRVMQVWNKKRADTLKEKRDKELNEFIEKMKDYKSLSVTSEKRMPKFIVSLTSFPQRMYDIHICLYSLMRQSLKPDEIVLYLGIEQFPNKEQDLPQEVLKLKENGLTIKFTKDIKSYKKLIPALKEYPNDIIITADDDVLYKIDWFEKLYNAYQEDNQNILCHRAHKIKIDANNNILQYKYWDKMIDDNSTSCLNFATGCAGILYPNKCFHHDIFEEKIFMSLAPNADDVWFWAMAILNGRKIKVLNSPYKNVQPVNYEREMGLNGELTLFQTNIVENDIQIKNVVKKYPEILDILKGEIYGA